MKSARPARLGCFTRTKGLTPNTVPPRSDAGGIFFGLASGRRFLLAHQSIEGGADFGKAPGNHGATGITGVGADAHSSATAWGDAQGNDLGHDAVERAAGRGLRRTPRRDGARFDGPG